MTFSLIINGVFIVLCLFLALSFMFFGYAMNKAPENYTILDKAVVATVLAPTSLCFDNFECLLQLQWPFAYALYSAAGKSPENVQVCTSPVEGGPRMISRTPLESFACAPLEKNPSTPTAGDEPVEFDKNTEKFQPSSEAVNPALWKEITSKALKRAIKIPKDWEAEDGAGVLLLRSPKTVKLAESNEVECAKPKPSECFAEFPIVDIKISRDIPNPDLMADVSIITIPNPPLPDRRILTYREIYSMADFLHFVFVDDGHAYNLQVINDEYRDTALTIVSMIVPKE
ncbi:MAG: hypothetical protein AAB416_01755 [Patescibacteria group bacterium]